MRKKERNEIEIRLFDRLLRMAKKRLKTTNLEQQREFQEWVCKLVPLPEEVSSCELPDFQLPARWIFPEGGHCKNMVLYFHGGAFVAGSEHSAAALGAKLAINAQMGVLAPGYRLAAEHPYPAALNDCLAAYRGVLAAGVEPECLALAGESAGGGLVLSLLHRLIAENLPLPACACVLSPWTDLTMNSPSSVENRHADPVLSRDYLVECARLYAGGQSLKDPFISPLFGSFKGFPPVLLQVGENEILLDDTLRVCGKLEQAGVPCTLEMYPEMWHVFQAYGLPQSKQALESVGTFINRYLPQ